MSTKNPQLRYSGPFSIQGFWIDTLSRNVLFSAIQDLR